jgi:tetratricopeptide (TPR) repeat protein
VTCASRPRAHRGRLAGAALIGIAAVASAAATPYRPSSDADVLAELPPGAVHTSAPVRAQAAARLDVALPLAQFYISQARAAGDLRFLGYADAVLLPWRSRSPANADVLVLDATILQSRHAFAAALDALDKVLAVRPNDVQAWLTRATVLRVLGRYDEARASCGHLMKAGEAPLAQLCTQSLRALSGHLRPAYANVVALQPGALSVSARAWRYSELGEMATRLGDDAAAAGWFRAGLQLAPEDLYTRAAYADLLLRQGRARDTLNLLDAYRSLEPLLLRIAIAQQQLHDPQLPRTCAVLANAFSVEEQRGEAVHRREQARFLLEVARQPLAALSAAQQNWQSQREPDDLLILLRAAQAAHLPSAAAPAVRFVREHGTEDVRLAPYLDTSP